MQVGRSMSSRRQIVSCDHAFFQRALIDLSFIQRAKFTTHSRGISLLKAGLNVSAAEN